MIFLPVSQHTVFMPLVQWNSIKNMEQIYCYDIKHTSSVMFWEFWDSSGGVTMREQKRPTPPSTSLPLYETQ